MEIHWIGFDADDTLWVNERLYREARARFDAILAPYGVDLAAANRQVDQIEVHNLEWYGYGAMSFGLSLIEAAVDLTRQRITGGDVGQILQITKDMITAEVELLEGAEHTLAALAADYPLLLITKGEPTHQRSKVDRSGLRSHFLHVEIVPEKTPAVYAEILARHAVRPEHFLMVGNSVRSDVLPVVSLGGWAVHIPSETTWEHEAADVPPELRGRVFEVRALSELAGWVDARQGRAAQPVRVADQIDAAIRALPLRNTPSMRQVRRSFSQQITAWPPEQVLQLALRLGERSRGLRWIGYELVRYHREAFRSLDADRLEQLGQGIDSWDSADGFARTLSGPAWLRHQLSDAVVYRWARSPDLWWRRAALVSTVALNAKVDGGPGDVARTLTVCSMLLDDREDMVVKALSWALRELVPHDPGALEAYLRKQEGRLAARVKREVRNKLRTGLKTPGRRRQSEGAEHGQAADA